MTESATASLDHRYGRARRKRADRRIAWIVVAVLVAIGLAVLFFGNWRANSRIDFRDLSYSVESDRAIDLGFEVSVQPGETVICALEALSPSFAQAGWKIVKIEPGADRTRRFDESLTTTVRAATAQVRNCWIA